MSAPNGARIRGNLPVAVAFSLLNEHRSAISTLEQDFSVTIEIVPEIGALSLEMLLKSSNLVQRRPKKTSGATNAKNVTRDREEIENAVQTALEFKPERALVTKQKRRSAL